MRSFCYLPCIALIPLLACSIGQAGSDSLGTSVGPAESSESSDTDPSGDGDGDPAGDGDGDATTGDGDGDATTGDGDGDATTGDGDGDPTTGDGLTDDYRYAYSTQSGSWSKIPLTSVWNDPNAPLETEIVAAARLTHMPWLMLFASDGYLYQRHGGAWQPRELILDRFPELAGLELDALYHVPSASDSELEGLTFTDNPDAVVFNIHANGNVEHVTSVVVEDAPPPGAPQGTGRTLWNFESVDLDMIGQGPDWWVGWYGYNDGFVYRFDAAFEWAKFPIEDNPFFGTGDEDEPEPTTMRASWFEHGQGDDHYLYMVGP